MLMYDRALKQFQEDINYGQLEEMSYNERFAFLLGFETSFEGNRQCGQIKRTIEGKSQHYGMAGEVMP